jgi:glycosyltransferase involved in cell wall biosynthesis
LDHFKLVAGIIKHRNAILHYHWLEFQDFKSILGMPWKMMCIYLFHKLGGNIVWTLHNEFPHDQKYSALHSYLHSKMARWASALHVHCATAADIMSERLHVSKEKFHLIPHPDFPAASIEKQEAIRNLNQHYSCKLRAEVPILLMFGNISRYKQIDRVAEYVLRAQTEATLVIAGPVKKGSLELYKKLVALQKQSSNIVLIPQFIAEEHVAWFYSAADFCVFNYREILSSGGYHMAKAYQKTVIAPAKGCLAEHSEEPNVHLFNTHAEFEQLMTQQLSTFSDGKA